VGLTTVKGDQGTKRPLDLGVDEHAEGESEQTLRDSLGEAAGRLCEMAAQPHLLFEVGEYRLDDESDARLRHLGSGARSQPVASRGDELDADELEGGLELAPPQALVGEQDRVGMGAGEPEGGSYSRSLAGRRS
jgi:hypothetical protein